MHLTGYGNVAECMNEYPAFSQRRIGLDEQRSLWPLERRRDYLLIDVSVPLSVDTRVWWKEYLPDGEGCGVLVTMVSDTPSNAERILGQPTIPASSFDQDKWSCLGYDVCDDTLLSGLLNCRAPEIRAMAAQLERELTPWHLFQRAQTALNHARVLDEIIVEHAPFFVFGLYVATETLRSWTLTSTC